MKGLLLAGGFGTRLRPLTHTGNKHMLPVANKPILFYGLESIRDAGVKEIGIIVGPMNETIRESIGDGTKFGVKVSYIDQPDPKGLAHAVLAAEGFIGEEPFVMYLGDNLLRKGIKYLVDDFKNSKYDAMVVLTKVKDPRLFGVAEVDKGRLLRVAEKPKQPKSDLAITGIYMFTSSIFGVVRRLKPSWRGELEITDAIQMLLDEGRTVGYRMVDGWWKDTGKPEDLLEANHLILSDIKPNNEGILEEGVNVLGNVVIGKNSTLRKNTCVRGPAIIGENCKIGPDTYVGPYTSIGNNVSISGGEVENSIIMDGVSISCDKRIVDSLIGRDAKITTNSAKPSGCRLVIGDNTYIGL
ncbi:MAG: glucose-1-phosphate thymidylyltransferase [Promethearchaeati archaeon SRVP18_Atabeyarchaeia-1]